MDDRTAELLIAADFLEDNKEGVAFPEAARILRSFSESTDAIVCASAMAFYRELNRLAPPGEIYMRADVPTKSWEFHWKGVGLQYSMAVCVHFSELLFLNLDSVKMLAESHAQRLASALSDVVNESATQSPPLVL